MTDENENVFGASVDGKGESTGAAQNIVEMSARRVGRPRRSPESSGRINLQTWEGYDPFAIYPRSSDWQGHSANIQVNIPKDVHGILGQLIHEYPDFKLPGDVIRTALVHYLHWFYVHRATPQLAALIKAMSQQEDTRQRRQRYARWDIELSDSVAACARFAAIGNFDGLALELDSLEIWMKEKPPYLQTPAQAVHKQYSLLMR